MLLNFEISKDSDAINILLDDEGIDDLIKYLQYVKSSKDHMHLFCHEKGELTKKDLNTKDKVIEYVTLRYIKE